ncbi:Uncharacterised protein [Anaerobiospirillum thomasii]|nr:Uncharacterised protein [Anaerobiospirillum thomasii]
MNDKSISQLDKQRHKLFNGAFWTNILRICIALGLIGLALIPYGIFFYLVNM